MRIYTRQGDEGSTGLFGGLRVSKANARVEAYGLVDELNAVVGWVRVLALPPALDEALGDAQEGCFRLGAWLASAPAADPGVPALTPGDVEAIERRIDALEEKLEPLRNFVLPGGGEAGARLHVARTVARRAERAIAALGQIEPLPPEVVPWINRLSDYLFVAARTANAAEGVAEQVWKAERT